ncbi:hypothetical protein T07_4958 [Trichinella nelsoni]|uniref:Uncharacterized protein n=1 Tax=Trichinella nelsoni TaxID=6336 RepID=A0A0V0RLN5_9BILA|nr:hypothetical protein T07_4958 [Trichinella nelsoni]
MPDCVFLEIAADMDRANEIGGDYGSGCFLERLASCQRCVKARDRKEGKCAGQYRPSPNSDGRVNNLVEEADEPARGSGPLQDIPKK